MSTFSVHNTTGETIPPYAAMKLIGRGYIDTRPDGRTTTVQAFLASKPDADSMDTVVFNGPSPIMPDSNGQAYNTFPCAAAYTQISANGSDLGLSITGEIPAVGEAWGTQANSWALVRSNTGFSIVQADVNGVAIVLKSSSGGASGAFDECVSIDTGVLVNESYYGTLLIRDDVAQAFIAGDPVWILDLAGSTSLPAGVQYPAIVVRDGNGSPVQEPYGFYYVSIVNGNIGNALTDTSAWSLLLTLSPTAWSAGTYPYGSYVSHSGHNYVCSHPAGTSGTPGSSSDWTQADVLNAADGYDSGVPYSYDPVTGADYVQEVRGLYAISSDAPSITSINGQPGPGITIESPDFSLNVSVPVDFWYCLTNTTGVPGISGDWEIVEPWDPLQGYGSSTNVSYGGFPWSGSGTAYPISGAGFWTNEAVTEWSPGSYSSGVYVKITNTNKIDETVAAIRESFYLTGYCAGTSALAAGTTANYYPVGLEAASVLELVPDNSGSIVGSLNGPNWNSSTPYVQGDIVGYSLYGNFVCIQNNTNQNPGTQPAYWTLLGGTDNGRVLRVVNAGSSFGDAPLTLSFVTPFAVTLHRGYSVLLQLNGYGVSAVWECLSYPGIKSLNADGALDQTLTHSDNTIYITDNGTGGHDFVARVANGTGAYESGIATPNLQQTLGPGDKDFNNVLIHGGNSLIFSNNPIADAGADSFAVEMRGAGAPAITYASIRAGTNISLGNTSYWIAKIGSVGWWVNSTNYVIGEQVQIAPPSWNSGTAYVVGDYVLQGTAYRCILGNTNQTPPNATYWVAEYPTYICILGNTNQTPPNATYWFPLQAGAWSSVTAYVAGDTVFTTGGAIYACIASNTNQTPPNATYWTLITPSAWSGATTYVVGNRVTSGGSTYSCILANTNQQPPSQQYWVSIYDGMQHAGVLYAVEDSVSTSFEREFQIGLGNSYFGMGFGLQAQFDYPFAGPISGGGGQRWLFGSPTGQTALAWNSGSSYSAGDKVYFVDASNNCWAYSCLVGNTNQQPIPQASSTYWQWDELFSYVTAWPFSDAGQFLFNPGLLLTYKLAVVDYSPGFFVDAFNYPVRVGMTTTGTGNPGGLHFVQGVLVDGVLQVNLATEVTGLLAPIDGGLGVDASAYSGLPIFTAGVVSDLTQTRASGAALEVEGGSSGRWYKTLAPDTF